MVNTFSITPSIKFMITTNFFSFKGSEPVYYWVWTDGMAEPVKKQAQLVV
jgi:hypothetical protein